MRSRLLLGAIALVVTAACNSGTSGDSGTSGQRTVSLADRIRAASETGTEAGTSKVYMKMDMPGGGMTADGAFDYEGQRGKLAFTFTGQLAQIGSGVEMVQLGRDMYMKMPMLAQMGQKPWLKINIDDALKQGGLQGLDQLSNSDPTASLAFLKGVAEDVREEGKEQVRGVETTRLAITVDLNKAATAAPAEAKSAIEQLVKSLGTSTMPMTVWVDADDRVRRISYSMDMSKMEQGATGTLNLLMEMYDYGTKVDVAAPPANQVVDASEVLGGGAGSGS